MTASAVTYSCLAFEELSLQQLYEILALRQAVFVVEQHCPYLDTDGNDQQAYHLLGTNEEGALLTYVRLLPRGISYPDYASIGRVVTAPSARGQGYGRPLMQKAIAELRRLFPDQGCKLSAQSHLVEYYQSIGFEPQGEGYLEDGIPHIAMSLHKRVLTAG